MALPTRRQLSLYVPTPQAEAIDALRRVLDPVQASLIPAHVTLCREDELDDVSPAELGLRLGVDIVRPIGLSFGPPQMFDGHGVLLPCVGDQSAFQSLRRIALGKEDVRAHTPHITLAHPRNPKASGNTAASLPLAPCVWQITFAEAVLIEQTNDAKCHVMQRFALWTGVPSDAQQAPAVAEAKAPGQNVP